MNTGIILQLILVLPSIVSAQPQTDCILVAYPLQSKQKESLKIVTSNNSSLKLVIINNNLEYAVVNHFVENTCQFCDHECCNVVGVVGDIDLKTASTILTLASRSNVRIPLVSSLLSPNFLPVTGLDAPDIHVLDMTPLLHYIDCLISFLDRLNWTRIGLITDTSYYYSFTAEILQKQVHVNSGRIIAPFVQVGPGDSNRKVLSKVKEYGTHVTVISASQEIACSLLQMALNDGFTWPDYAWIMYNLSILDQIYCDKELEGVIFFQDHFIYEDTDKNHTIPKYWAHLNETLGQVFKDYPIFHKFQSYNILHDSIIVLVELVKSNSQIVFSGSTGLIKFREGRRLYNISIIQIQNSSQAELARYDSDSKLLKIVNTSFLSNDLPRGSILMVHERSSVIHISLVLTIFTVCITFVTVCFILFLYFHNEPEIKATSFSLSICMYLGCYLMLLFIPLLLIEVQPLDVLPVYVSANAVCNSLAWLSVIGLPDVLILATLFVKMLRVYIIFSNPHSYKKNLFCTSILFLYVFFIVSPNILILTFMSALDPFFNVQVEVPHKKHLLVLDLCVNDNIIIWLLLSLVYTSILITAIVILGFMSSNIRYKHFKDTKATNGYSFLAIFVTVMTLVYWYFFRSQKPSIHNILETEITLYAGHIIIPISCQIFLFIPKIYPPISRCIFQKAVKHK